MSSTVKFLTVLVLGFNAALALVMVGAEMPGWWVPVLGGSLGIVSLSTREGAPHA